MSEVWRIVIDKHLMPYLTNGCEPNTGTMLLEAAQDAKALADVAHKLNTHAALVEALTEFVAHLISGATFGLNDDEVLMLKRGEAAIAAAKGATSEQR